MALAVRRNIEYVRLTDTTDFKRKRVVFAKFRCVGVPRTHAPSPWKRLGRHSQSSRTLESYRNRCRFYSHVTPWCRLSGAT